MTQMKVFAIGPSSEEDDLVPVGVAYVRNFSDTYYPPKDTWIDRLPFSTFDLRDGGYADYHTTNATDALYSPALRALLDKHRCPLDTFEWLPVTVCLGEEERQYFFLHVLLTPGILDAERSKFAGPRIAMPAFKNLQGHGIFCHQEHRLNDAFITEPIKKDIERHKMTGIGFFKTRDWIE